MFNYVLRRILQMLPTLLGVVTLVFLIVRLVPGCPAALILGEYVTVEAIEDLRARLGLDEPIYRQYISFMGGLLHGDLGDSIMFRRPVFELISRALPHTTRLAFAAVTIGVVVGVPLGIIAAVNRNSVLDVGVLSFAMLGLATPSFWFALLAVYIFGGMLGWFPIYGQGPPGWGLSRETLHYLVLPAITLGVNGAGTTARMTRSCMLDVLQQDYTRTARAKGLGELTVVYKHALRNAVIPVVTVVGLSVGGLLGGAVLVETVFARVGLGKLLVDAIFGRDYPTVQACVAIFAVFFMAVNLMVDLTYAWIDPRIRYN